MGIILVLAVGDVAAAGEADWKIGAASEERATPGRTTLRIANTGREAFSIQIVWSGGMWSAQVPPGRERSLDLKTGGRIDYYVKAGAEPFEGVLEVEGDREFRWPIAYQGKPVGPPAVQPLAQSPEKVDLLLPADEFAGFDQLPIAEKIAVLEQALAGKYRGHPDLTRGLSVLHNNSALALQEKGEWDAVWNHFRRALELAPQNQGIRTNLAISRHNRALQLAEAGNFAGADRELTEAVRVAESLSPEVRRTVAASYADVLVQWGIEEEGKGWVEAAGRRYDRALGLNPENAVAWVRLGEIYYAHHKLAEAADCYRKALAIVERGDFRKRLDQIEREIAVAGDFTTNQVGRFRISFAGRENSALARDVLTVLRRAHREVGRLFRHYPDEEIPVVIYDSGQFGHVTQLNAWAGAAYDGKIRLRVDPEEKGDKQFLMTKLQNQIYHEYAHAVIHSIAGAGVPGWLHEGLAQYAAGEQELDDAERDLLRGALARGNLPSLGSLGGPLVGLPSSEKVSVAYVEARSFVSWLVRRHGLQHIRSLLSRLGKKMPLPEAFVAEFGRPLTELEADWRRNL